MITLHNLGFPRIGPKRELKFALEAYWHGDLDAHSLTDTANQLLDAQLQHQKNSGLSLLPVGDFSLYDHVLDTSFLLGNLPKRFHTDQPIQELDQYFRVARGRSRQGEPVSAGEMTKWFDTNYHYIVPEFDTDTHFSLHAEKLLAQIERAKKTGCAVKPVILGPLTYLWLGKCKEASLDKLSLLQSLVPVYAELLAILKAQGIDWVQVDEPILALDLEGAWKAAFSRVYDSLVQHGPNLLLTSYFGPLLDNIDTLLSLPVAGIHVDAVRGKAELPKILELWPTDKVLSLGVIDGRNIWRTDINTLLNELAPVYAARGDKLWLAPSCSLLHVPVSLTEEDQLNPELRSWLAFASEKLDELALLGRALEQGPDIVLPELEANARAIESRRRSAQVTQRPVQERLASIQPDQLQRQSSYPQRAALQHERFRLPLYPTTTIGSFPQTAEIRQTRLKYKQKQLSTDDYVSAIREQIAYAIQEQEHYGLDVLVHGEAERNDMVEYFGEQLQGYAFTRFGWVQSYGSRCVKPPIIYGDVSRPNAMTVDWTVYAQSLTQKLVKGMLTGPVTMLQWAFVRDDQPRHQTALQIALALRDEVQDLEAAGIQMIQVDEPAFREGMPLRRSDWQNYLQQAAEAFRLSCSGVLDSTQIHTHMCYSEFNGILDAIADMDADVITIETSRSDMELLDAFAKFAYPNEIGPGVYDIHSPNVPSVGQMVSLMRKASQWIPAERLWVNPDCGLKTRQWNEVAPALKNLVQAAQQLRAEQSTAA